MTSEWDSPDNIADERQSDFDCGRIVARMPDLDECQAIRPPLSATGTVLRRFIGDWIFLSRFRRGDDDSGMTEYRERTHSNAKKVYVFSSLILVGILCITIGGIVLYKEHRKARKAEKAAVLELQKKEAAEKKAEKKRADEEAAAKKKADEEAAAKKKADEAAAAKKKADEEAAAARKKAEQEAAAKRKAEQEAAANPLPEVKPDEKKPDVAPVNGQSPWDRTASEAYSPWGMATTRQADALQANQQAIIPNVQPVQVQPVQVQPPSVPLPAIPIAPGVIGRGPQGTVNPAPPYNTMIAPPAAGMTAYRPYTPPMVSPPQNIPMSYGRVPTSESQVTYQNGSGTSASGHYVPSAVHELSQVGNPLPQPVAPPSAPAPNVIRPLGPIPGQPIQIAGDAPRIATTTPVPGYPPPSNYPSPPVYQPQPGYQPQPVYQPQPQPNYQQPPNYQPVPYQPQPDYRLL